MQTHYEGTGRLLQDDRQVHAVQYAFAIAADQTIYGAIWSDDQFLLKERTFRLQLAAGAQYVAIMLSAGLLDLSRMEFRYSLFAAPDQVNDPHNLLSSQAGSNN